jgi:hypothetical protein
MPSLTITPVNKTYSSSTVLGTDLSSASSVFDINSTILGSSITDKSTYNLLKTKYEAVYEIDKSYNQLVTSLQKQLVEQNQALEIQADIDYQKQGNIAAEMGAGLSTGAQAIQANELSQARQETSDEISQTISEYATQYSEQIASDYESAIESVLGKKNDDGTYANIVEYQEMADSMMTGLIRTIAAAISGNDSLYETDKDTGEIVAIDPYQLLADNGLLVTTDTGDYELTDAGYAVIDQILNGYQPFGIANGLTDTYDITDTAAYKIADQACREKYGTSWDTMDSDKKESIRKDYMDWLADNGYSFRATNAGLFDYDDDGEVVVDMDWSFESNFADLPSNVVAGIDTSGEPISIYDTAKMTAAFGETFTQAIVKGAIDGSIANGNYVMMSWAFGGDDNVYVYYNGVFYTAKSDVVSTTGIPAGQMVSSDFGNFFGSNSEDSNQNKYTQAIIKAANSGKIADGTYVNVNYGTGKAHIWQYSNGNFIDCGTMSSYKYNEDTNAYKINGKTVLYKNVINNKNASNYGITWE